MARRGLMSHPQNYWDTCFNGRCLQQLVEDMFVLGRASEEDELSTTTYVAATS